MKFKAYPSGAVKKTKWLYEKKTSLNGDFQSSNIRKWLFQICYKRAAFCNQEIIKCLSSVRPFVTFLHKLNI